MPSWQAKILNTACRLFVRRQRWGKDERGVARRARQLFGAPKIYQWLKTRGVSVSEISESGVRGDWIAPKAAGEGVILYIHGGGFVSCSPRNYRPLTAALARLGGWRVFSVDYRLAPENRFPAALDDVFAAYQYLLEQGFPAGKIAVAGDSAGGGLVLSLLLRVRDEGLPPPACGVCFSAWADLTGTSGSVHENDGRCAMFRTGNITEFAAVYLGDQSPREPYASPALAGLHALPPVLLQVGSTELLVDDARLVDDKIRAAGGTSELHIYDDLAHGWHLLDGMVPESREALQEAVRFIGRHLEKKVSKI
jgi:monoterpene epsilon-lactone hydrolase